MAPYYGPPAKPIRETVAKLIAPPSSTPSPASSLPARQDGLGLRGELIRQGARSFSGGPPTALVEKDGLLFWRYADGTYLPAPPDAAVKVLTEGVGTGQRRPSTQLGRASAAAPFVPSPTDPAALEPDDVRGRVLAALDTGAGMVVGDWSGLHRFPRKADHPAVVGTQQHGYRPQLDVGALADIGRDPRYPRQ